MKKTALSRIFAIFFCAVLIFSLSALCLADDDGDKTDEILETSDSFDGADDTVTVGAVCDADTDAAPETGSETYTTGASDSYDYHVIDVAEVLSDTQLDALENEIVRARAESGVDFYFVTVKDFTSYGYGEDDVSEFTMDILFKEDVFGVKETDSAAILVFSTDYRDFCTYSTQPVYDIVRGEIEEYIEAHNILPNVRDNKDDYYSAALAFVTEYSKVVKESKAGTLDRSLYKEPFGWFGGGVISAIVGLIAGAVKTGSQKSKLKTVHFQDRASKYTVPGSLEVDNSRDTFLYSHVSRVYVEPSSSRSSGGGGSSFSGGSHGGGGRSGKY
ncbi:MAG: TPM domain-containing protein [Clostridia bacterium]|nr:TPM domain-containing protein [Clostridia bacterium]